MKLLDVIIMTLFLTSFYFFKCRLWQACSNSSKDKNATYISKFCYSLKLVSKIESILLSFTFIHLFVGIIRLDCFCVLPLLWLAISSIFEWMCLIFGVIFHYWVICSSHGSLTPNQYYIYFWNYGLIYNMYLS